MTIEEQKRKLHYSLTNHKPDEDSLIKIEEFREYSKSFGDKIIELCPDGRYKSIALTNLEETVMWAIKSIILDKNN